MIGYPEQKNAVVRKGIDMLLEGSSHEHVYKFLEKKKSELKQAEMGLWDFSRLLIYNGSHFRRENTKDI